MIFIGCYPLFIATLPLSSSDTTAAAPLWDAMKRRNIQIAGMFLLAAPAFAAAKCSLWLTANHLFGELLKIKSCAPHHDQVPYQGRALSMQGLRARQIESMQNPISSHVVRLMAGLLRALAVSRRHRLLASPNIPTFAKLGFPKLTSSKSNYLTYPVPRPRRRH